ncbi:hypothetical protein K432DRAFT_403132 [Lepidopterella palustris CBS 459.81]|uniref:Uncharacterized protein n=1 Tax=Lepidopterella palustris CBS 459.81 TaxID=1314670 RepID=A0A8E2EDS3_9PEZI|nr:hypothetical protein K432DRAFT_403132 [Lepidopterella palustris CBS 459.81]
MSTLSTKSAATLAITAPQDELAQRLEKLETRINAINVNNIARVASCRLRSAFDQLHVLHSLKTGRPIENYPTSPKEIAKLSDTLVDAMLLALEAEGTGTKEQKMERLRMQMGLTPKPV